MKSLQNIVTIVITIGLLISLAGCQLPGRVKGDVPKPSLGIPGALTGSTDSANIISRSVGESEENVFEPFRASLTLADHALDTVNQIIDAINQTRVPDSGEFTQSNGDVVSISTDSGRTYSKRIEWTNSDDVTYLQVNYTPGEVKGSLYYVETESGEDELSRLRVDYDDTGDEPAITGWLALQNDTPNTDTTPRSIYFQGVGNGDVVQFHGGVAYDYVISGTTDFPEPYDAEHAYMFQAVSDESGDNAEVNLYFPDSAETATELTGMSIKASYLDILFEWIETKNGEDLDTYFSSAPSEITSGQTLGDALANEPSGNANLDFVTSLDNPINYGESSGYLDNGSGIADIVPGADPADVNFSVSPADVFSITEDSAQLAFLSD